MRTVCLVLFTALGSGLQSQAALQIENAALRHQLAVLQRQARGRPRLRPVDRLFWTWLCHLWPGWRRALVIVKPDTVLRYCQKLWMGLAQAASFLMPSTKGTPLMTSTIN